MPKGATSPRAEVLRVLMIERRRAANLTQDQLAAKLNWHQSTIATIENGQRRVSLLEFIRLAEALDIDICKFMKLVSGVPE